MYFFPTLLPVVAVVVFQRAGRREMKVTKKKAKGSSPHQVPKRETNVRSRSLRSRNGGNNKRDSPNCCVPGSNEKNTTPTTNYTPTTTTTTTTTNKRKKNNETRLRSLTNSSAGTIGTDRNEVFFPPGESRTNERFFF